jgi:2-dehydropantoate 2-reductase
VRLVVLGAGALGASYGGRLAEAGQDVTLVDLRAEHVAAIARDGLEVLGVPRPIRVRVAAFTPDRVAGPFDVALVTTDTNGTADAAAAAARLLAADGFAVSLQNGIGNLEVLEHALGRGRVVGGSSMCSFRGLGPGRVEQTHMGPTTVGELDGTPTPRVRALAAALEAAGYPTTVSAEIQAVVWTKFVLNSAVNPLCALTGLRIGEIARLEPMDRFQDLILDEIFEVVRAKGIRLDEPELRAKIKDHSWRKFSKPSMLQHIEAGRRTEVDALNGALLREAAALGIEVPYNRALVALLKGRELHEQRRVHEPGLDYDALERAAATVPRPGRG